ncbi:MAG: DUF4433 domain-containing protein [Chloroflexi bacterium]|nr:DUF4433 domain-containing protein [Chloroflexota bacterium]
MTRADCQFSDGNMASSGHQLFSTADELAQLPWGKIYHSGSYDRTKHEETDIAFRRCAEAIVPNQVDLNALRYICCRSEAEKETLLHLLPPTVRRQYRGRITATNRFDLFERRHTFVKSVRLYPEKAYFEFWPDSSSPGPFHCVVTVNTGEHTLTADSPALELNAINYRYGVAFRPPLDSYEIRLTLDRQITYANRYENVTDIPF